MRWRAAPAALVFACILGPGLCADLFPGLGGGAAMAAAEPPFTWPDSPAARAEAEARLLSLQAALAHQPSATRVLGEWCARYHLAPDPQIVAIQVKGAPHAAPASVRHNLALRPGEALGYRRVRLLCGALVLSDAENWYVPDRLTPAMNALLDHTDTPFGLAVKSLHFTRRTLASERLWRPEATPPGPRLAIPEHVLRNIGLLTAEGGAPISQVIENYTAAVLGPAP
ncbi:hypothetical protein AcidC75_06500 [Acidisoma sp. C75]